MRSKYIISFQTPCIHSDVMDDSKIFLEDVKVTDWILILTPDTKYTGYVSFRRLKENITNLLVRLMTFNTK